MKNKLSMIILLLLVCLFFSACTSETSNDDIQVFKIPSLEHDIWTDSVCSPHVNDDAPEIMEAEFEEAKLEGKYSYSIAEMYNTAISHYYDFNGGWFSVNSADGSIETVVFTDISEGRLSAEDCIPKAKEIAEKYIDTADYALTVTAGYPVHSYQFIRQLNGIDTNDMLSVGISSAGEIASFTNFSKSADIFRNTKKISAAITACTSQEALGKMEAKINEMYENCSGCNIISDRLIAFDGENFGIVYTIDIELAPIKEEGLIIREERIELLVCG